jgi:hypothetical protein
MGAPLTPKTETIVEKVCDCDMIGGQTYTSRQFFNGGATIGGSIYATTSVVTTKTLTSRELPVNSTVISWLPNVDTTLTLTATSVAAIVPNVGDVTNLYFRNASTTAAATVTFAADSTGNVDLQYVEATGGDLVLAGLDWAKLTIIKTAFNKVSIIFDEMTEAD